MQLRWKINEAAVAEAAEVLGLTFPVRVRVVPNGPAGMAGKYHGLGRRGPTTEDVLDEPVHHISLSGKLFAKMASKCLWHEMTHAKQNERFLPSNGDGGEEEPYVIANRGLQRAFRAEMKEVRQRYGGTPSQLTMRYGEVSFEREACKVMDDAKEMLVTEFEEEKEKDSPLLDDKGRATWRVDVYERGKWNKKIKRREPDIFVATRYALADEKFKAKKWAREQESISAMDAECYAYQIKPKGGGK